MFDDLYEMGADFLSYVVMGVIALIILIPFSIFAQILKSPKATLLLVLVAVVIIFVLFGFHEQLHRLVKEIIVKYINNSHQLQ
ncbi:MAG: hypothetical protein ACXVNF_09855 [Neobacillus sp.]